MILAQSLVENLLDDGLGATTGMHSSIDGIQIDFDGESDAMFTVVHDDSFQEGHYNPSNPRERLLVVN